MVVVGVFLIELVELFLVIWVKILGFCIFILLFFDIFLVVLVWDRMIVLVVWFLVVIVVEDVIRVVFKIVGLSSR